MTNRMRREIVNLFKAGESIEAIARKLNNDRQPLEPVVTEVHVNDVLRQRLKEQSA